MTTTIHVYSERNAGEVRTAPNLRHAMRDANSLIAGVLQFTRDRTTPLCIDITTTIGMKTYQYIQVLDGSTLFVGSLISK